MSTITRYGVDLECTEIPFDRPIKKISGDVASLLILSTDGCVFALGKNGPYFGIPEQQLYLDEPVQLDIQNATDIYHAEQKSLILTNDNTLYVMGIGSLMNLGFKESKHFDTPTAVPKENYEHEKILFVGTAYSFSVIVTANKNLFLFGQNWLDPQESKLDVSWKFPIPEVSANGEIVSLTCGTFHVAIINSAGEIFLGGGNSEGGCGTTGQFYGLKKYVSNLFFTSAALFYNASVLAARDGTILFYGKVDSRFVEYRSFTDKFPLPIQHVSASVNGVTICTYDGQVFLYQYDRTSKKIGDIKGPGLYRSLMLDNIYTCAIVNEDQISKHFYLLSRTIIKSELQDVVVVIL